METKRVTCAECGKQATQYSGDLPTKGMAKVLVAGIVLYVVGIWVLVALAFLTLGADADMALMEMLIVLSAVVSVLSVLALYWMFRPKKGAAVACPNCGARYAVTHAPNYTKGWALEKLPAPAAAALEDARNSQQ